jgi:outer membrane receptor protein involved in Fe transport
MKHVLTIVCTLSAVLTSFAQASKGTGRVTGVVIDSLNSNPVEFANVTLYDNTTNKPVDGTVCDLAGKFELVSVPKGSYNLVVSFIGYGKITQALDVGDKTTIDLGRLILSPQTKILKEVEVLGQKTLVEEKVDRTIYNAEQDATTKGGDATDVLKRVPMLSVDADGNVSLRGSTSIKVLINNKPSTITASSVADALKQIPADMIKTVEVITSPSAKYDAEGSAGIINIVLKKNTLDGRFFNVEGSVGTRGSNIAVTTNYRNGKMGFSVGAFVRPVYNVIGKFRNDQTTRSNGDTVVNLQNARTRSDGVNSQYTLGWDYDINKYNSLSASLRYGQRSQNAYQDQLLTQMFIQDSLPKSSLKDVKTLTSSHNIDASLNYTKSFPVKNREFNFMAIFSRNDQTTGFLTNTLNLSDNSILNQYKNDNPGSTRELTFQADYQEPLPGNQLVEFGAKDIIRTVSSDYKYFIAEGAGGDFVPVSNGLLSNGFSYNQSITSGYLSYTLSASHGYTFKAGGRYEYTHIEAHFQGESNITIPSYGVLVPSINISRKLSNGNLLKASYNRRIQRPSLQNLNPNLQASNPLNATLGNPYLKPEYADNFEIAYNTYVKNASLNFSTFVRYNTNDIQQARSVRNDTIIAIFQNIGTEANYGASIFTTIPFSDRFSVNGGIDMFYRILKNNSNDPFINASNHGLVKNYRISGNYNFKSGWTLQFFSFFPGRNINLQGYRTNPISHSLSVRKDLWKKNGSLGIGLDNFATPAYDVHTKLESPYIAQTTTNTLYNFIAKVTLSYKIGKITPPKNMKGLQEDDGN